MFANCTSLVTPPKLPATILEIDGMHCYQSMFANCTSLEILPKLPATILDKECYRNMFNGCSKIKMSLTQDSTYKNEYRIPVSGNGIDNTEGEGALTGMFNGTGGTFTGTPTINTTYYTANEVK